MPKGDNRPRYAATCDECGVAFTASAAHGKNRFCSKRCAVRPGSRSHTHRRTSKGCYGRDLKTQYIPIFKLWKRDGKRCYLCGEPIDLAIKFPHRKSISVDMVVPMSKNGDYVWDNVKAAHRECNGSKSNTSIAIYISGSNVTINTTEKRQGTLFDLDSTG